MVTLTETEYQNIEEALDVGVLMTDPENQPPQYTLQKAVDIIGRGRDRLHAAKSNINVTGKFSEVMR